MNCFCSVCCKKQTPCTCNKTWEKKPGFKVVKDCICAEWSVSPGQTQTIFQSAGYRNIYTSGFISVNNESTVPNYIIVRFYLGDVEISSPMTIFNDSSAAFALTEFDRITVESVVGAVIEKSEGEICINLRTKI